MVTMVTNGNHADYEAVVKLSEDFNGADLRNVCTEAGMLVLLSSLPIPSLPPPPSPSFSLPSSSYPLPPPPSHISHVSPPQECLQFVQRESL